MKDGAVVGEWAAVVSGLHGGQGLEPAMVIAEIRTLEPEGQVGTNTYSRAVDQGLAVYWELHVNGKQQRVVVHQMEGPGAVDSLEAEPGAQLLVSFRELGFLDEAFDILAAQTLCLSVSDSKRTAHAPEEAGWVTNSGARRSSQRPPFGCGRPA